MIAVLEKINCYFINVLSASIGLMIQLNDY